MKRLLLVAALAATPVMADTAGVFYDPMRRLSIAEYNWFEPMGAWKTYGFIEAYRLPAEGFPSNSTVVFGKAWLMRDVAKNVSVGMELEFGRNNAGMWTQERPFQPNQWRAIPKLGVSMTVR